MMQAMRLLETYERNYLNTAAFLVLILLAVCFSSGCPAASEYAACDEESYESARVLSVRDATQEEMEIHGFHGLMDGTAEAVELLLLSGRFKGDRHVSMLARLPGFYMDIEVSAGDRLLVLVEEDSNGIRQVNITDHDRRRPQTVLLLLFCAALVALGGRRGLRALAGLGITVLFVIFWLMPMIVKGYSPIWSAMLVCSLSALISVVLIAGLSRKTSAALAGTVAGVFVSGIIAVVAGEAMRLTGAYDESAMLLIHSLRAGFDFRGLLYAGMLVGAMGAVMDIAVSIATSVAEVAKADTKMKPAGLFRAGMNVGRDMSGTMANTLVLAYLGSSLPLSLLIYVQADMPWAKVGSLEIIAAEVVRSASGSIGLLAAVPVTAFVSAVLFGNKTRRRTAV